MRLDRTRPIDHEVDVLVKAEVARVAGEPGSLSVPHGWEINLCTVTNPQTGETLDLSEREERQVEAAVLERAAR